MVARLQSCLPNELEPVAEQLLLEPGVTKVVIAFALGRCRSTGPVWTRAAREIQTRYIAEEQPDGR